MPPKDDRCVSNWFDLSLPTDLHFHPFNGLPRRLAEAASDFPFPHRIHENWLVTFATSHDVHEALSPTASFGNPTTVSTQAFIDEGDSALGIAAFDASNIVTDLVQKAWNASMEHRGFAKHELASGYYAWFYPHAALEKNRAYFVAKSGRRAFRQLVGHKSKRTPDGGRKPDGFWHYAISGSPQLHGFNRLAIHHHVIFTDDGTVPWPSAERMHKARRSVCKQWWNAEWRDRLFAICAQLAGENKSLELPVGEGLTVQVAMEPLTFTSPWSYFEDNESGLDETSEIELVEDQDEGGDDEVS